MNRIDLNNTKQSKHIQRLESRLSKVGWKIINETPREFKKKLKWELNDEIPNLIYSWTIQRNPDLNPLIIDFIAWFDYLTYETFTGDCTNCQVRNTSLSLNFNKDQCLLKKTEDNEIFEKDLKKFIDQLNEVENHK